MTFFPKLVELAAGASRNIRIGINAGVARDVEQSFRLFVEELPDQSTPAANAVAIRTKVGIPVFVRPAKPTRTAVIDGVSVDGGKVMTRVRNTGNLHINVETIRVKGYAATRHVQQGRSGLVRAARRDADLRSADDRRRNASRPLPSRSKCSVTTDPSRPTARCRRRRAPRPEL